MRKGSKYTKHLKYVQKNIQELGFKVCAKKIGVSEPALKKQITEWRNAGHDIPHLRYLPVGSITERNDAGIIRKYIKTESGWRRFERVTPYAEGMEQRARQQPKKEKQHRVTQRIVRKEEKPMRISIPFDPQIHTMIRVDGKTWKQVLKTA